MNRARNGCSNFSFGADVRPQPCVAALALAGVGPPMALVLATYRTSCGSFLIGLGAMLVLPLAGWVWLIAVAGTDGGTPLGRKVSCGLGLANLLLLMMCGSSGAATEWAIAHCVAAIHSIAMGMCRWPVLLQMPPRVHLVCRGLAAPLVVISSLLLLGAVLAPPPATPTKAPSVSESVETPVV